MFFDVFKNINLTKPYNKVNKGIGIHQKRKREPYEVTLGTQLNESEFKCSIHSLNRFQKHELFHQTNKTRYVKQILQLRTRRGHGIIKTTLENDYGASRGSHTISIKHHSSTRQFTYRRKSLLKLNSIFGLCELKGLICRLAQLFHESFAIITLRLVFLWLECEGFVYWIGFGGNSWAYKTLEAKMFVWLVINVKNPSHVTFIFSLSSQNIKNNVAVVVAINIETYIRV